MQLIGNNGYSMIGLLRFQSGSYLHAYGILDKKNIKMSKRRSWIRTCDLWFTATKLSGFLIAIYYSRFKSQPHGSVYFLEYDRVVKPTVYGTDNIEKKLFTWNCIGVQLMTVSNISWNIFVWGAKISKTILLSSGDRNSILEYKQSGANFIELLSGELW